MDRAVQSVNVLFENGYYPKTVRMALYIYQLSMCCSQIVILDRMGRILLTMNLYMSMLLH